MDVKRDLNTVLRSSGVPPKSEASPLSASEITKSAHSGNKVDSRPSNEKWTVAETPQDYGLIPTVAVTLWLGWMGCLVYMVIYLVVFGTQTERRVAVALCTLSLVLPRGFPGRLGFRIGDWICVQAQKYFGLKTTIEDAAALRSMSKIGKSTIFAFEPHDILPYAVFAYNTSLKRVPMTGVGKCLMTSAVFRLPLGRQIYTWVGGAPIDKQTFKGRLDQGNSVVFVPGGMQEVTLMDPNQPDDLVLYLRSRKGFIKLALATGSPVVPVFGFGIDGSYGYYIPNWSPVKRLAKMIGFLPLFFWGRYGIPFGIPNPKKLHVVVGKLIHIPFEGDSVQSESIEKYHALFLREMEALFERHKNQAGYGHRKLKIL